ncbi:MAG: hypothetical protein JKY62_13020 [Desulfocapsa sp.]|uniref:Uncharacterized protein n=1 Tax=Desulfotalea psychrophila TaxID=84980 RepID=A0ABS3AU01_9BACT|nr:hypothetical protein [Desulfocapsa sp.]MBN4060013.1 hypothetical protein [Desulfotalea psychrophila]MBN4068228.1 hypothetical protein [Desulfotalea psychrophila]
MSYDRTIFLYRGFFYAVPVFFYLLLFPPLLYGDDEFSFDLGEIEKKALQTGGFLELRSTHMDINQGSVFSNLNLSDPDISTIDQIFGSVQLDGSYEHGIGSLNWTLKAAAQEDTLGWSDTADIFSAYLSVKPAPSATLTLGKKSYKWGKGYAWNPVGFINRPKDPNNPDEALEGYITAESDLIKSYQGSLQTAALTLAVLPVGENINEDFGKRDNVNLAAKLYLLYMDTDIDIMFLTGNSRSNRVGLDFSTNLAPHFEIHGELAYIPELSKIILGDDNSSSIEKNSALSTLLGIRYLFDNDVTAIIEYYFNGGGYSEEEMDRFYQLAEMGFAEDSALGSSLLGKAREMSLKGYGRPQPGRQYLYAKFTRKEPFDILYFTPGITTIFNLEDESYSIIPEGIYSGFTNWEFRLRVSLINGGKFTEFGEKTNSNKIEFRVRYFF